MSKKILVIDIETSPHLGRLWNVWQENLNASQLLEATYVLCFSAQWVGKKEIIHASSKNGHRRMLRLARSLLNRADIVIHYNGRKFDIRHLNREFMEYGIAPPSSFDQLDLYFAVRRNFNLPWYSLEYVAKVFGLPKKGKSPGMECWLGCINGDPKAWEKMKVYNMRDIVTTHALYHRMLPWLPNTIGFKRIMERIEGKRK